MCAVLSTCGVELRLAQLNTIGRDAWQYRCFHLSGGDVMWAFHRAREVPVKECTRDC